MPRTKTSARRRAAKPKALTARRRVSSPKRKHRGKARRSPRRHGLAAGKKKKKKRKSWFRRASDKIRRLSKRIVKHVSNNAVDYAIVALLIGLGLSAKYIYDMPAEEREKLIAKVLPLPTAAQREMQAWKQVQQKLTKTKFANTKKNKAMLTSMYHDLHKKLTSKKKHPKELKSLWQDMFLALRKTLTDMGT